ncbi:MAG: hypothetical protein WBF87_17170 [Mesorhizobium sp.]
MRQLILASVAVLSFAGIAAAQEAPALLYGQAQNNISNFSSASTIDRGANASTLDRTTTASVRSASREASGAQVTSSGTGPNFLINMHPNYKGGR